MGLEFLMDLLLVTGQGWIFYRLVTAVLGFAGQGNCEKWRAGCMLVVPFAVYRLLLSYAPWLRQFFYGSEQLMNNSRDTIFSMTIGFLILLGSGLLYHWKKRRMIFYLVLLYAAVCEMLRFAFFCLTAWFPNLCIYLLNECLITRSVEEREYLFWVQVVQSGWQWIFFTGYIAGCFFVLCKCIKFLRRTRMPQKGEFLYLMLPVVISLGLGVLLRSLWMFVRDGEVHVIFDQNPALYGVIPGVAVCCVVLILASIQMRCGLIEAEEERSSFSVYQSQVEELARSLQDTRGLQEGLRGMRHDMKNYTEDLHALLRLLQSADSGESKQKEIYRELLGYLERMERTMEQFEVRDETGNPVTDVIISRFRQQALREEIAVECRFSYPQGLSLHPFDLSVILNNAWNNAIEACRKCSAGKRFISLLGIRREQMFLIEMRNSMVPGSLKRSGGRLISQKQEPGAHGLGLKNMRGCVKKYGGWMECREEEGVFVLTVLLQSEPMKQQTSPFASREQRPENEDERGLLWP